jgi:hypothetical protein
MRKFVLMLMLLFSIICSAQVCKYKTTEFALRVLNQNNTWSEWSDWQDSFCTVILDSKTKKITIQSREIQVYTVTSIPTKIIDEDNCIQTSFKVIDQDGDKGIVRFRITTNGIKQMYIDFANVSWAYNLINL